MVIQTYIHTPYIYRTNRRIITNEKELIRAIENKTGATVRYIEFGVHKNNNVKDEFNSCNNGDDSSDGDVNSNYGGSGSSNGGNENSKHNKKGTINSYINPDSTFIQDIHSLQDLRLLIGGQGSGLINGLYLRPKSNNIILYQYLGWDVFNIYLKPRGEIYNWYNLYKNKSFCNLENDPFCDSPNTEVDIDVVVDIVVKALKNAKSHCV